MSSRCINKNRKLLSKLEPGTGEHQYLLTVFNSQKAHCHSEVAATTRVVQKHCWAFSLKINILAYNVRNNHFKMFIERRVMPGVGEGPAGAQQAVTQPGSCRLSRKSHRKPHGESLLGQAPRLFYKWVLNSFFALPKWIDWAPTIISHKWQGAAWVPTTKRKDLHKLKLVAVPRTSAVVCLGKQSPSASNWCDFGTASTSSKKESRPSKS